VWVAARELGVCDATAPVTFAGCAAGVDGALFAFDAPLPSRFFPFPHVYRDTRAAAPMEHLASVFEALRVALKMLQEHYAACDKGPLPAWRSPQDLLYGRAADLLLPYPLRAAGIGTAKLELGAGAAADFFASMVPGSATRLEAASGNTQLVYRVKLQGGRHAVVKFCTRPFIGAGEVVHRLWAAEALAPHLLFAHRLPGGIAMVGMELLDPDAGWRRLSDVPTAAARKLSPEVQRALAAAHALQTTDGGVTVHGDMRPPNVMVRLTASFELAPDEPNPVRFLDFDWAGVAGVARCPGFLNPKLKWPAGMAAGEPLSQALDREMLAAM